MEIIQNLFPRTHTRITCAATMGEWLGLGPPVMSSTRARDSMYYAREPYPKFTSFYLSLVLQFSRIFSSIGP